MNNQHGVAAMAMRIATEITTKGIAEQVQREAEEFARFSDPEQNVWRDPGGTEIPMSDIFLEGISTGTRVSGAWLEAAVQWNNFYVLFMTYDCPFEESLGIHLLDNRFNPLDFAYLGQNYASGKFSALALIEPNSVQFRFFDFRNYDGITRVELLPRTGFRIPFLSEPLYVSRPFNFSRHFIVREIQHPLTS